MDFSEREFLLYKIRSGYYKINLGGFTIKIVPPTIEDILESCEVYDKSYYESLNEDIMTQEECLNWMFDTELWTYEEDEKIKKTEKEAENLKVNVFKNFNNSKLRESARLYLKAAEKALKDLFDKKHVYHANTCEGIAELDKALFLLERCSYIGGERLDFNMIDQNDLLSKYYSSILKEKESREIARTEPWKSIWILRESNTFNLFNNNGRELSIDQKNLLVWSRMYDNIQESLECPSDKVIDDDDALDGWFIEQRRKQQRDRVIDQVEGSIQSDKIKNSQEIIVFANNKEEVEAIHEMNSPTSKMIKREREAVLKTNKKAADLDFQDQKLKLSNLSNQQFKQKFRR